MAVEASAAPEYDEHFIRRTNRHRKGVSFVASPNALLPTPIGGTQIDLAMSRLSDEEYEKLVLSPYLTAFKRKFDIPVICVSSYCRLSCGCDFDKELEGCLPGVAGVRQSKEYKKIRRKISEIDALRSRKEEELDAFQILKVKKRSELVDQIRHMLVNGIEVEQASTDLSETLFLVEQDNNTKDEEDHLVLYDLKADVKKPAPIVLPCRRRLKKPREKKVKLVAERAGVNSDRVQEIIPVHVENRRESVICSALFSCFQTFWAAIIYLGIAWVRFFIGHASPSCAADTKFL